MAELHTGPGKPANIERETGAVVDTLPQEELGAIGRENEDVKSQCADVVRKFDELVNVRSSLISLFDRVGTILGDRERTESALVERSIMLARAERAQHDLKAQLRALHEESEGRKAESSLLTTENERLKESVHNSEARIEAVEAELRQQTELAGSVRKELEVERNRVSQLGDELQLLKSELRQNDTVISQLQIDLAATRDEKTFAENRLEALQAKLAESQQNEASVQRALSESQIHVKNLSERIREVETTVDAERRQIKELEALLSLTQKENLQAAEESRFAIAALESQIDKLTTHSQTGDKLLADGRAQLQAMTDQFRGEARRAQDLESKLNQSQTRQENDAAEIAQLKQALKDKEIVQARLADRTEAVIRHTRDLKTRLEKAEQRAQLAGERLAAETNRFEEQRAHFEQAIRDLTEQLEKEKLSRTMVEGALEAAREGPNRELSSDKSAPDKALRKTGETVAQKLKTAHDVSNGAEAP
ncbi:MAG TPA: hypothetical protein VEH76_13220 [Methylocystis sp.]|nr:hypothetical protein [Methylocystis sp.]